jgi:putative membrane protein
MNQPPLYNWTVPQRQATAGLLIIIYKAVVNIVRIIWPFIVVLLVQKNFAQANMVVIFLIALPVFILARSLVEFFYFRFYIAQDELIIKKGFISRKVIAIPLAKIQAVHIEQHLLHRVANVAKVIIDTAGSEKAEAVIDAITVPKAESLKLFLMEEHRVFQGEDVVTEAPKEQMLIRLSFRDLLKLGISSNHIQAFFIVLAFIFSTFQNIKEALGDKIVQSVEDNSVRFFSNAIPLLVALVLIISVVVSMVRILLNYYDFQLTETDKGYKLKTGLINTRQYLVRYSKIQFVSWEANWVRRKIGMFNLEFHQVAGEKVNHKQKAKVPITRPEFLEKLVTNYHLQNGPVMADSVHRVHAVYPFRRILLVGIIPVALLLLIIWLANWNNWFLLLTLWIPYVYFNALVFRKNFYLYVSPDALQINSGIWGRKVQVLKWYKIQQVIVVQSIYQRQHQLASLKLVTAGGILHIPYVTLQLANLVRDYALYEIERSPRPWL